MISGINNIELFDGVLQFDVGLFLVDIFILICCIIKWYKTYSRTGQKFNYMIGFYFMYIVIPIIIQYPFSGSYYNVLSVGNNITWVMNQVNTAYVISVVGFLFMIIGSYFKPIIRVDDGLFEQVIDKNVHNQYFENMIHFFNCSILGGSIIICSKFPSLIFNARAIRFLDPSLGMLLNFILAYATTSFLLVLIMLIDKVTLKRICSLLVIVAISILMGNRSTIIMPLVTGLSMYFMCGKKIRISTCLFGVVAMLALIVSLSMLRSTTVNSTIVDTSDSITLAVGEIFYGNTFSDLRDFAWVLTGFDDSFLYGKTYLAALLGFIPSSIFEYRAIYGIGDITNYFAGIQFEHFGLRIGIFGESYINFGMLGVILTGFIIGNLLRATNKIIQESLHEKMDIYYAYSRIFKFYIISSLLMMSANMITAYVFVIIHMLGYLLRLKKGHRTSVDIEVKY